MHSTFTRVLTAATALAVSIVGLGVATTSVSHAGPPLGANTLSPTSGNSGTTFSLLPPAGAACTGSGSGTPAYRWQTFMVSGSVDASTLTFGSGPNAISGAYVQPLYDSAGGNPVVNRNPSASPLGQITNIPTMSFASLVGVEPPAGVYKIGFACTQAGNIENGRFWETKITITPNGTTGGPANFDYTFGTVPAAPVLGSPLTVGNGTLSGTFTPTASTPATTGYTVTAVPTVGSTVTLAVAAGATSFTLNGLTNNVQYAVKVKATNNVGDSVDSNTVNGTPVAGTVPAAPVLASPLTVGNGTLSGTFTPTASTPATTGYTVTAVPTVGSTVTLAVATGATSFTLNGLTNGVQYAVSIKATNLLGDSVASNTVNGTPGTVPAAPSLASPLTVGDGTLAGTFTVTPASPAITGFTVTAVPAVGSAVTLSLAAGATSFAFTGLANGVSHAVTVTAINALGIGPSSNIVNGTPVAPVKPTYQAFAPGRLLDTRAGGQTVDGLFAGIGLRDADSVTTIQVAGRAGVPADASAVVLNVTVTGPTGAGYVTVFPCGSTRPTASSLNYVAGATVPNAVISKLGNGGTLCLYTQAATHLIVDINGYYPLGSSYTALNPARLLETRNGLSTIDGQGNGGGPRAADSVTELQITGRAGVPADAAAAVLNVTVTEAQGAGYVTVFPCGSARPNASSLNYVTGSTVANAVISKIGDGGKICLYTQAATQLIVDINGYLPGDGSFTPLVPARLLETRPGLSTVDGQGNGIGQRGADSVTEVQITGRAGVPSNASAAVLNVTVTGPTGPGFVTVFPCGTDRPNSSNLNYTAGVTVPNAAITKIGAGGKICFYTQAATDLIVDINGYVAGPA